MFEFDDSFPRHVSIHDSFLVNHARTGEKNLAMQFVLLFVFYFMSLDEDLSAV